MKNGKLWLVIAIVIIFGSAGWSYSGRQKDAKKTAQIDPPKTGYIVIEEKGKSIETVNVAGAVDSWDPESGRLVIVIEGKPQEFIIDKVGTKVLLGRTQNLYRDPKMSTLYPNKDPLQWKGAFCKGDGVSALIDKNSGEVAWIMNVDRRMCGFKEEVK